MLNKRILFLIILIIPFVIECRTSSSASRQSQAEANAEARKKEDRQKYYDAVKKHEKNQTKKTRERMKSLKSKSETTHVEKKPCFLVRWFTRKPKPCTPAPSN